jgi:hypothetical protein
MPTALNLNASPLLRGAPVDSLDWDDARTSESKSPPYPSADESQELPRRTDSQVRIAAASPDSTRTSEARSFLDRMQEDQLNLTIALLSLDGVTEDLPYDVSARAAGQSFAERVLEIHELYDAVHEVFLAAGSTADVAPLFAPDAALRAYMSGICMWLGDVIPALGRLAGELRVLQPDWSAVRTRIREASMWYFDGLPNEIRAELERLPPAQDPEARKHFTEQLELLFWAAGWVDKGLEKPFG